jgi:hypothetical protein
MSASRIGQFMLSNGSGTVEVDITPISGKRSITLKCDSPRTASILSGLEKSWERHSSQTLVIPNPTEYLSQIDKDSSLLVVTNSMAPGMVRLITQANDQLQFSLIQDVSLVPSGNFYSIKSPDNQFIKVLEENKISYEKGSTTYPNVINSPVLQSSGLHLRSQRYLQSALKKEDLAKTITLLPDGNIAINLLPEVVGAFGILLAYKHSTFPSTERPSFFPHGKHGFLNHGYTVEPALYDELQKNLSDLLPTRSALKPKPWLFGILAVIGGVVGLIVGYSYPIALLGILWTAITGATAGIILGIVIGKHIENREHTPSQPRYSAPPPPPSGVSSSSGFPFRPGSSPHLETKSIPPPSSSRSGPPSSSLLHSSTAVKTGNDGKIFVDIGARHREFKVRLAEGNLGKLKNPKLINIETILTPLSLKHLSSDTHVAQITFPPEDILVGMSLLALLKDNGVGICVEKHTSMSTQELIIFATGDALQQAYSTNFQRIRTPAPPR